jgi:hypothetical protein
MLVISPREIGWSTQAAIAKCLSTGPSIYRNAKIINESTIYYHRDLCRVRSLGPAPRNPRMVSISPLLFWTSSCPQLVPEYQLPFSQIIFSIFDILTSLQLHLQHSFFPWCQNFCGYLIYWSLKVVSKTHLYYL